MEINVNLSKAKEIGTTTLERSKKLKQIIENLRAEIGKAKMFWAGADSSKLSNVVNEELIADLLKLENLLTTYGTFVQTSIESYENLDNKFSSQSIEV